jgi:glucose-1-phosphate thymidylyltransferase
VSTKGIILAGGAGSRLYPATLGQNSKQLLPVYDKPMIYYPISLLMLAGVREILIITSPDYMRNLTSLIEGGSQWGLDVHFARQREPRGLPQAYTIAKHWLGGGPSVLVLGDNIFHGHGMPDQLSEHVRRPHGATVFTKPMPQSHKYGVLRKDKLPWKVVEKPEGSHHEPVVTGLYVMDGSAPEIAEGLEPSARGELEIADLLNHYADGANLQEEQLGRGIAWFDAGNPAELLETSLYVKAIQDRQGAQIACLEEIALNQGWITREEARESVQGIPGEYGDYVRRLVD